MCLMGDGPAGRRGKTTLPWYSSELSAKNCGLGEFPHSWGSRWQRAGLPSLLPPHFHLSLQWFSGSTWLHGESLTYYSVISHRSMTTRGPADPHLKKRGVWVSDLIGAFSIWYESTLQFSTRRHDTRCIKRYSCPGVTYRQQYSFLCG